MSNLLIVDCIVDDVAGLDIRITDGLVAEIGHGLSRRSEPVLDAHGCVAIAGLHDHHLHLHALAARRASVECGPPHVRDTGDLAAALHRSTDQHGWVRGVGYFESVAGDLDRDALDGLCHDRPVRIQHRSGAMWMLNSAGIEAIRLDTADNPGIERDASGRSTGRIWRADAWLRERIPGNAPPSLAAVGSELAGFGITGVTDATPDLDDAGIASIVAAVSSGDLPQRVHLLGAPLSPTHVGSGITVGPYKIVLADSGLPDLDALAGTITAAHAVGRPVAAHAVSREALLILLSVLAEIGCIPGDRIEHGALIPAESIAEIARLGLIVVTQPGFITDRGDDYLAHVEPADIGDLYRCGTLLDSSVPVAFSSDAPYGPLDPWTVIAAARSRTTSTGRILGSAERVSFLQARDAYLGGPRSPGGAPRRLTIGAPADLALTDQSPSPTVSATVIGGCQVY